VGVDECRHCPELRHPKPGEDVLGAVLHEQRHHIAPFDPLCLCPVGVAVGPGVELLIGDQAVLEADRDGVGGPLRPALDHVGHGFTRVLGDSAQPDAHPKCIGEVAGLTADGVEEGHGFSRADETRSQSIGPTTRCPLRKCSANSARPGASSVMSQERLRLTCFGGRTRIREGKSGG